MEEGEEEVMEVLVKNWMNKNVVTVDANDSMREATRLLKENDIKMLPVMDETKENA